MGATATLVNSWYSNPPCLGSDAEFAAARRVFLESGYTYANLCAFLGVDRLYEYRMRPSAEQFAEPVETPLAVMNRLFCQGLHLDRRVVERILSRESRAALYALHLLDNDPDAPEMDLAPATVLPFLDALTVTDRFCVPSSGEPIELPSDAVYPALYDTTYNFVTRLPQTPCEDLLDLGTGTGAAAICQAPFARRIWATDITPRAVYFAEFNRRLNGCANISTGEGDLYAPVRGRTFDRIVTQPPYVAAATEKVTFRDGGPDGEQIFRRAVEGVPEFLRPGGTFYALLMATDREGETFEQRIRKWLGPHSDEFDLLLGCNTVKEPMEFLLTAQKISPIDKEYLRVLYEKNKTRAVLYCSVILHRKLRERPPLTMRTFVSTSVKGTDFDFLLAWNGTVASPGGDEILWNVRPRLGVHCELHIAHRVRQGRLVAEEFELQTHGPFTSRGKTPAWVAKLVTECDGSYTWGERFQKLQAEERIPPGVGRKEFIGILAVLVSTGVLEVSEISVVFNGG